MRARNLARRLAQALKGLFDARAIQNSRLLSFSLRPETHSLIVSRWGLADATTPGACFLLRSQARQLGHTDMPLAVASTAWSEAVWRLESKQASYLFAAKLGIPHVPVLDYWERVRDIPLARIPPNTVIKPDRGHSAAGVYIAGLDTRGSTLRSAETGEEFSARVVFKRLSELERLRPHVMPFLAEPVMRDDAGHLATEWKFYVFYGQVGLIHQVVRRGGKRLWKHYDPEFRDLGSVRDPRKYAPSLPGPKHTEVMVSWAELLSENVPLPACRIDFYEQESGPLLGEITTTPAAGWFAAPIDQLLGGYWESGNARLMSDLVAGKQFVHFASATGEA